MNHKQGCLFVGLGSPRGDDRLGWIVAEELGRRGRTDVMVRQAAAPADLLDWLPGVNRLLICDACMSPGASGTILRFDWPDGRLATLDFAGTHDLNLPAVLELADRLNLLPPRTTIWSLAIDEREDQAHLEFDRARTCEAFGELSSSLTAAIPALVARIEEDW